MTKQILELNKYREIESSVAKLVGLAVYIISLDEIRTTAAGMQKIHDIG